MKFGSQVFVGSLLLVGVLLASWLALAPRQAAPPSASAVEKPPLAHSSAAPLANTSRPLEPTSAVETEPSASQPTRAALAGVPPFTGPLRDKQRADGLREALTTLYAGKLAAAGETDDSADMPAPIGSGNQAHTPLGRYVDRVMQEQFVPLASSCYEALLERQPDRAGNVELAFSIMGDRAVGGVVVDVNLGPASTLRDKTFETCISESMYAVVFEAPPDGHPTLTVTQSFELAP